MYQSHYRFMLIIAMLMLAFIKINGQTAMPDELNKSSLKEQLNYLETKTRIYENYRAIREDMFQKIKKNITDSLTSANTKIGELNKLLSAKISIIDSLNTALGTTRTRLGEMTSTKNSIKVLGIEVNKTTYNSLMWTIIFLLALILVIGFLLFKRNLSITSSSKKDFKELKEEFEVYRKTTREAREKMSMEHFKEVQRLKGGGK
jgi:hypothetical protein